jgi:hypothetical protein
VPRKRVQIQIEGVETVWKVRLAVGGLPIHVISRTQPKVRLNQRNIVAVEMDVIEDTPDGDTIGFIDWAAVTAVTWRKA